VLAIVLEVEFELMICLAANQLQRGLDAGVLVAVDDEGRMHPKAVEAERRGITRSSRTPRRGPTKVPGAIFYSSRPSPICSRAPWRIRGRPPVAFSCSLLAPICLCCPLGVCKTLARGERKRPVSLPPGAAARAGRACDRRESRTALAQEWGRGRGRRGEPPSHGVPVRSYDAAGGAAASPRSGLTPASWATKRSSQHRHLPHRRKSGSGSCAVDQLREAGDWAHGQAPPPPHAGAKLAETHQHVPRPFPISLPRARCRHSAPSSWIAQHACHSNRFGRRPELSADQQVVAVVSRCG